MRYPAVAGAFYERSRDALLRQIKECYTHPLGPGRPAEVRAGPRRLVGLVVPHAGYVYSGPVAAHSYAALATDGWPKSFVIFGPNHHGQGAPLGAPPGHHARCRKVFSAPPSGCHAPRVAKGARRKGDEAKPRPRPKTLRREGGPGRPPDVGFGAGDRHADRREAPRCDRGE